MVRTLFLLSAPLTCQIRAAHNLLSLTHTLKLLHLFSDPAVEATNRERESARLEKSIADLKAQLYSSRSV